jgi:hypothetical protein
LKWLKSGILLRVKAKEKKCLRVSSYYLLKENSLLKRRLMENGKCLVRVLDRQ